MLCMAPTQNPGPPIISSVFNGQSHGGKTHTRPKGVSNQLERVIRLSRTREDVHGVFRREPTHFVVQISVR